MTIPVWALVIAGILFFGLGLATLWNLQAKLNLKKLLTDCYKDNKGLKEELELLSDQESDQETNEALIKSLQQQRDLLIADFNEAQDAIKVNAQFVEAAQDSLAVLEGLGIFETYPRTLSPQERVMLVPRYIRRSRFSKKIVAEHVAELDLLVDA